MKCNTIIVILIFFTITGYAQTPRVITDSDMVILKLDVQKEAVNLRQKLMNNDYLSDYEKKIMIDFQIDTFMIERLLVKRISIDYSTTGMCDAVYDSEIEYDRLLNKYYQILLKKLNDSDKAILRQSQVNWIKFRDTERKLNEEIAKDEYSGGGTMQRNIVASGYAEITKERIIELYGYLCRFYN
jgi:uncharacterized protein YecT (DUF1311 family)